MTHPGWGLRTEKLIQIIQIVLSCMLNEILNVKVYGICGQIRKSKKYFNILFLFWRVLVHSRRDLWMGDRFHSIFVWSVVTDAKPVVKKAEQFKSFIFTIVFVIGLISSISLALILFALAYLPWPGSIALNINLCILRYASKSSKMNHPLEVTAFSHLTIDIAKTTHLKQLKLHLLH